MTFQDLDVIKSRTLFMKSGVHSGEVLLVDPGNENMYFTFRLRYTSEGEPGSTQFTARDAQHADVIIDTRPNAITEPSQPIWIGTYGNDKKDLYLGFVVQPQIGTTGLHSVIVTFYTGKEAHHGNK